MAKVKKYNEMSVEELNVELNNCQGISQEISGYYMPKESALYKAMRPSLTLNNIIDNF